MKTKRKEINPKYLPTRLPIVSTAVLWLLLDRMAAPQWLWGAAGLFVLAWWAAAIYVILRVEFVKPGEIE